MTVQITLTSKDRDHINFRSAAERMAKFLYNHREYMRNFVYIIRNSYDWNENNYKINLQKYLYPNVRFLQKEYWNTEAEECYKNNVTYMYSLCKNNVEINILRGMLPEYLNYHICKLQSNRNWSVMLGCSIKINDDQTIFVKENDKSKMTVDVGAWNFYNQCGIFSEVKVSPDAFNKIDALYLQTIRKVFKTFNEIKYKIYIFSLERIKLMKSKINSLNYELENDTIILDEVSIFEEKFLQFS